MASRSSHTNLLPESWSRDSGVSRRIRSGAGIEGSGMSGAG